MIYKRAMPDAGLVEVIFELPAGFWADRVALVGDFNGWDPESLPFHQDRDGCWRLRLALPVGQHYQFLYLVDGEWCSDYCAAEAGSVVDNPFGGHNCVLDTTIMRREQ